MIPVVSVRRVIDQGIAEGLLPTDTHRIAGEVLAHAAREHLPWYLRVLTGGAAWIGSLFLLSTALGIVALVLGERVDAAAVLLGLGLMPGGVRLRNSARGELARQAALVSVIAGQLLVIGGAGSIADHVTAGAIVALLSSVLLVIAFDDAVYGFCGTLGVVAAILVLASDWHVPYALGLVIALVSVAPVAIWRGGSAMLREHHRLDPVAWACVVATCGLLLVQTIVDGVTGRATPPSDLVGLLLPTPWPLAVLFASLLVWLGLQVARDHGSTPTDPGPAAALLAVGVLGLLTLPTPAVTGALLLVVLGFDRRRAGVAALAAAFLIAFLGLHYYSLALTLLQKSAVLMASGAVCLAAAWFFAPRVHEVSQ